jgi:hypothetical protein
MSRGVPKKGCEDYPPFSAVFNGIVEWAICIH